MRILITGATGFVGRKLCLELFRAGHHVVILSRNKNRAIQSLSLPVEAYEWKDYKSLPPEEAFFDVEVVINLMGEGIANKYWSKKQKQSIYDSRVLATENLVKAINSFKNHSIRKFISTSAIGIYESNTERTYTEIDEIYSKSFLSQVCQNWEKRVLQLIPHISVSIIRVGLVLGDNGGLLQKLKWIFGLGATSALGNGKQWMSWIHIEDLVRIYILAINKNLPILVNACSPNPVTNKEFSNLLAKHCNRFMLPSVPSALIKLALGEMSQLLLDSQKVQARVLSDFGFKFKYEDLNETFAELLKYGPFAKVHEAYQYFPKQNYELFDFFKSPSNLESITPPWLNFKITYSSTDEIEQGTIYKYKLKLHGLPIFWKTEIKSWNPPYHFRDFQLKGPYVIWDHLHEFIEIEDGILMRDKVDYVLPFSFLGNLLASKFVQKDVNKIFSYREKVLSEQFGVKNA